MEHGLSPKMVLERVKLPSRGIVTKGFLGKNEDESLAIGDTFHLLTSKKEQVIECLDRHGRTLILPCSTTNRFFKLKDSTSQDNVDAGEVHADYATIYGLEDLMRAFQLPISVRMVSTDAANQTLSDSSAFALLLQREISVEYLVLATEEMYLVTVPIDLDIEFKVLRPPTTQRGPVTHTPDLTTAIVDESSGRYNAVVSTGHEYGILNDASTRQHLDSGNEDLYESLIDYQEVRTVGGASSQRLGNYATLQHARGQSDGDKASTLKKKLKMAQTHLQTSQQRQEVGSPIIAYWEREVKNIESTLRSSEAPPAIPQRRGTLSNDAAPASAAVSPPPAAGEPVVYKTFGDAAPSSPPSNYQAVHTFAHVDDDNTDGPYSMALKVNSSTMIPVPAETASPPPQRSGSGAGTRPKANVAPSRSKTPQGGSVGKSLAMNSVAASARAAAESTSAEIPKRSGSGALPGPVKGPPSPAEFALQKQQFLYAQKRAFQKAHGSVKPGVTKGGPGGPGGPTMTSVQKQLLKQRTPHPGDVGARVSVVGYNCFGTLRYYGPTPGSGQPCCGVELESPDGLHNGTVNGHKIFSCVPKHGIVVHPRKVMVIPTKGTKGDTADGAASGREVIQGEEITYKTVEEKEADEGAHRTFYLDSGIAASGQEEQYSTDGEYAFATDQVVPQLPTKDEVSAMDIRGIHLLLKTLGLYHLQKTFADNAITGKMFVELDETMLIEDLGVTKKFDRLKILQFQ